MICSFTIPLLFMKQKGHWDAGSPTGKPTPQNEFLKNLWSTLQNVQEMIVKPAAKIFVLTVNQHPIGYKASDCIDWRVPPMIDAYNRQLRRLVTEHPVGNDNTNKRPRVYSFQNMTNAYLVDNADIMDPIWDGANDWNHPCRNAMRPMALRVLSLLYS